MVGDHCHKCRSIKVHPGGHLVSLVLLCSCWLDPAVNVNDSIWFGTTRFKLANNGILKFLLRALGSHCQQSITSDLSIILGPYGEQPWPPLSCTQAHPTSPCQEQPDVNSFQNYKNHSKFKASCSTLPSGLSLMLMLKTLLLLKRVRVRGLSTPPCLLSRTKKHPFSPTARQIDGEKLHENGIRFSPKYLV